MTIQEFDQLSFTEGMRIKHRGIVYDLASVDFQEKLMGFIIEGGGDELSWARCENCELIKQDR